MMAHSEKGKRLLQQRPDNFSDSFYYRAIRTKLGEGLRQQYDLMEPLPQGLVELLGQLDTSARVRDATRAKLYAEVKEGIKAMGDAANRKPREPREP
jgi:hypothetical protein